MGALHVTESCNLYITKNCTSSPLFKFSYWQLSNSFPLLNVHLFECTFPLSHISKCCAFGIGAENVIFFAFALPVFFTVYKYLTFLPPFIIDSFATGTTRSKFRLIVVAPLSSSSFGSVQSGSCSFSSSS